jgi:pyridoxamine 5'-phosphate oxidase like protein
MANDAPNIDRVWELMEKIGFAMLVSRDGNKLRARPMSAYLERECNAIYFLTDARHHKDEEIAANPVSTSRLLMRAARSMCPSRGTRPSSTIAPKSKSCSRHLPRPGGRVPMIQTFAC